MKQLRKLGAGLGHALQNAQECESLLLEGSVRETVARFIKQLL